MYPGQAQKGISRKSELFSSLKMYLNNKNRLQPIIGLGSIIECVAVGARNIEALYLCEVCVCRLSKADMRNHIMGSLHRHNYIKAYYPCLVSEWKENSDLSKLARPLMEIAKTIEGKEGAGDVQLLELEDAVYQKMATHSENDAVTMINSLRDWQVEPESNSEITSLQLEDYSMQSQRIVLLARNQLRRSGKSHKADMISHKTSAHMRSTVAPPIKSESWLKNITASQLRNTLMSPEPSVLSDNSNSFLDGYTGTRPLIGLFRVVECRSEDGNTCVFLCHCCRIRTNKKDIIDHLTSSSHLINYLMEKHPEQVAVMTADMNDNCQLIQSLARKVEQEEGRGELKVINIPESLCIPLTGKSYHWCIKILCNGWTHTSTRKSKITVKGPSMNKTSVEGMPEKRTVVMSKWAKKKATKRNIKKVANTVFKVSLPLTKGAVLLERMSFSKDSLPMSYSHSSASDIVPVPDSQTEDRELDYDPRSFALYNTEHTAMCTNSQDLYSGDAQAGQNMGPERIFTDAQYQGVDGYFSINEDISQSRNITWTNDKRVYGERNYDRQHGSQERSRKNFNEEFKNEGLLKQNEELKPAVFHAQNWSSYHSSYRPEEGYAVQWYSSASQSKVGTTTEVPREERQKEMSSDATQQYCQQQPQNHYTAADQTSLLTGSMWHHGLSGESAPCSDATSINVYPQLHFFANSGSIAPEPRGQFLETEQRQMQKYMEFTTTRVQTTPQSYMMQPAAYQAVHIGHGVMSNPNYSNQPGTNLDQHFAHPESSSSSGYGGEDMSQSNTFIPPVQTLYYGTYSDLNFRDTRLPGLMISRSVDGATPFMCASPNFNSAYIDTPYGDHSSTRGSCLR
ncbi:uncharacterized protein [Trachinotus anak]|uniref:uncharacterized protein n=1 Tax=Trachinotus anak TaxID=443729 RepID=UPI0039F18703